MNRLEAIEHICDLSFAVDQEFGSSTVPSGSPYTREALLALGVNPSELPEWIRDSAEAPGSSTEDGIKQP